MANTIQLTLSVDDKGAATIEKAAVKATRGFDRLEKKAVGASDRMRRALDRVSSGIAGIISKTFSWRSGLVALAGSAGLGLLAKSAIDVASSFEQMEASLDTLTGGRGMATLKELNDWALRMPVDTERAVQSYRMMTAMGLVPTIQQMTTLVDTMGALGGNADTLEGIARALGQIATKGKVSAEELMQLAERGIPVFQILQERFGNVETSSLRAGDAIEAIFAGLEDRFGGQSQRMQGTWSGLMESLKSYWKEFQRLVMESGLFDHIRDRAKALVDWIGEMQQQGKLEAWADQISAYITDKLKGLEDRIREIPTALRSWHDPLGDIERSLSAIAKIVEGLVWLPTQLGKLLGNTAGAASIGLEQLMSSPSYNNAAVAWSAGPAAALGPSTTTSPSKKDPFALSGAPPSKATTQATVNMYINQNLNEHKVGLEVQQALDRITVRQ